MPTRAREKKQMGISRIAFQVQCGMWVMLLWVAVQPCFAQEFRVDSEVFHGDDKQPIVATLTVFTKGLAYDFQLTEPKEITIFDPTRGHFTMLDRARAIMTDVSTQDLLQYSLDLEAQATASKNALVAFAAQPKFETSVEEVVENGEKRTRFTFAGKPLGYMVLGQTPPEVEMARIYRNFADWSARLNATRTHSLPANARLVLNEALAEKGLLPLEVRRTITPFNPLGKKDEMRSQHLVNGTLSNKDQGDVNEADTFRATFRSVSYDEYRTLPSKDLTKSQAKR
jgi:hypothetical protein